MVKLSIIVPVYNSETYIEKCADSLAKQTYHDSEIIFVNDGSTDLSMDIIIHTLERYEHVQYKIIDKQNGGLPLARKTGIENAKGEYIGFVDSDDWVDEEYFRKCMNYAEKNHADIVRTGYTEERKRNGKRIGKLTEEKKASFDQLFLEMHKKEIAFHSVWGGVYRKNVFSEVKFPTKCFVGEDYWTLMQVLKGNGNAVLVPDWGYHYRCDNSSMSRRGYGSEKAFGFEMFRKTYKNVLMKYRHYKKTIRNFYACEYLAVIVSMARNEKCDSHVIRYIREFVKKALPDFVISRNIGVAFKICAIMFVITPVAFMKTYGIYSRLSPF